MDNSKKENFKIEKECFFKWINLIFKEHNQLLINNLKYDLRDGSKLLTLINILSRNDSNLNQEDSVNQNWNKIERSLDIMNSHDIDITDLNAAQILDGDLKPTLSMIWKIIMYWQIKRPCEIENLSDEEVWQFILKWCNQTLEKYGLGVGNYTTDWKNGLALNALLHSLDPDSFDLETVKRMSSKESLAHAFKLANEKYGIGNILEPADVDRDNPDSKCILLYVSLIYQKSLQPKGPLTFYDRGVAEYWNRLDNITAWLKAAEKDLSKTKTISRDIDQVKEEFNQHENFITSLMGQQSEVFNTLKQGKTILSASGNGMEKGDKAAMIDKMKSLNALWERIRTDTLDYQSQLQNALNSIQKQQMASFESWLEGMEELSKVTPSNKLSPDQVEVLKTEFEKGTTLIKPLSNMLVVVDSEEDQDYKVFEDKLSSLQNRYLEVCKWAEGLKDGVGTDILTPTTVERYADVGSGLARQDSSRSAATLLATGPSPTSSKFKMADELKMWNVDALAKLEALADYYVNGSRVGEDLPSFKEIKQQFELNQEKLNSLFEDYKKSSVSKTPDLNLKKQLDNIDRTMNYIKFRIEKLEPLQSESQRREERPSHSPPGNTSFKKVRLEPSESFKGRQLGSALPLSSLKSGDGTGEDSLATTVITPLADQGTPPPSPTTPQGRGVVGTLGRVPSIEITSEEVSRPLHEVEGDEEGPVPSVHTLLSKKRESLSVPSEFPELTIPCVESEELTTVHLSQEPYASEDIERIHIDIYDINEMLKELEAWFLHAKDQPKFSSASQTKEFSDAIENCSTKLDNIKALWPKIEETRNLARIAVSQSGDETYQNLLHDSNNMIHRWEGLFEQTNQYFETLVNMLEAYHYQSFQEPLTSLNRWLDNVQSNLISESNKYNQPEIMEENLKKLHEIQSTIHGQAPNLTSIRSIWEEKMSDDNFHFSLRDKFQNDIDEVVVKFDKVCQLGDESANELDKRLSLIKNYMDEIKVLKSWMEDLNKILESDSSDSETTMSPPKLKEDEFKGLQENLDLLKPNLDNINKATPRILENCDIDFAKKIKDEVQSLNQVWKRIINQADKEKTWFNYDDYVQYLDRVDKQIDSPRIIETEKDLDVQIEILKNLLNDLDLKKSTFYTNLPSGLFPQGAIPNKEEEELNAKYNTLVEKIDSLIDFYQTSQSDYIDLKGDLSKTGQHIDAINLKLQYAPKERRKDVAETLASELSGPGDPKSKSLGHLLNRRLSGLREKAKVLEKNKILPVLVKRDIEGMTKRINDIIPQIEGDHITPPTPQTSTEGEHFTRTAPLSLRPDTRTDSGGVRKGDDDDDVPKDAVSVGTRLDANILRLQEWIVHEDMLIMSHLESDSKARDLPAEEYAEMVKDFKDKDTLFHDIERDINDLPDRAKADEMRQQLQIMKTRFQNVQATFEDFEMPPELVPRLKRIRLSLADIKSDVEDLKLDTTKPTGIREQLDRCMRDCYRLSDVKSTLEELNKDLPDMLADENSDLKKEINEKLELLKNRYNDLGDKANDKKAALQAALEFGDKFQELDLPLNKWIKATDSDMDEMKRKVNPNSLSKEINYLKQLETECKEKDSDIKNMNDLLDEYRTIIGGTEDEKLKEFYDLSAQRTKSRLQDLRAKIDGQKEYYGDLEKLYEKFNSEIGNVKSFVNKAQQVLPTLNDDSQSEVVEALSNEMEESRATLSRAQTTGSEIVGQCDNFRTTTLSELASLKKQFEDIAHQIEGKAKGVTPLKVTPGALQGYGRDQDRPQNLEQEISFGIARLNDFSQQLEPRKGRITPIPNLDPDSERFKNPLEGRIKALKSEYDATQSLVDNLKAKTGTGPGANRELLDAQIGSVEEKWVTQVKPLADSKLSEYRTLASAWEKFVEGGQSLGSRIDELSRSDDKSSEKTRNFVGLAAIDLESLRNESAAFTNTELEPASDTMIAGLEDKLDRIISTSMGRSYSICDYPRTPPPTPSLQPGVSMTRVGQDEYLGGGTGKDVNYDKLTPTNAALSKAIDRATKKMSMTSATSASTPPVTDSSEREPADRKSQFMTPKYVKGDDSARPQQPERHPFKSSFDRLDYSSDPYEFLWEIGNIRDMVRRLMQDLNDPHLFGTGEPEKNPLRRERLGSIKEALEAISPGIEGSESHKNDLKKYNDDQNVDKQIEDSLENLKSDWNTLNVTYNDKLNLIADQPTHARTGSDIHQQKGVEDKPTPELARKRVKEAAEISKLPDKFNVLDQEPPEAIELVSRLQSLGVWLQKCEGSITKPIPLFNESALREEKSNYKAEEAQFPSKLKILKDSETALQNLKETHSLAPDKVERIKQLIDQARDKYIMISKDYGNKRQEVDNQYNRIFHFSQQLEGLASWLKSTRVPIEQSLSSLKEDDVKDIHNKLGERQTDYDQLNYTYVQLVNDGLRYNELYDADEYHVPDEWTQTIKQINADWDFIQSIDPKDIQKTVYSEKLQAAQPSIQAKWPKVQQDMYQLSDKLGTIENYLTSRIVDLIDIPQIDSEVMSIKNSLKEVKNLKVHLAQVKNMESNKIYEKAGYKDDQISEVQAKCDSLIETIKDRIMILNAMRQDALQYDYFYTSLCEWLRINNPILRELVDMSDRSKITDDELRKNHDYLMQKVPTYSKLCHDLQFLAQKMGSTYTEDDPSSLNSRSENLYKLWYSVMRGQDTGKKVSVSSLGKSVAPDQQHQQALHLQSGPLVGNVSSADVVLTPNDLKEFRSQLESFKVALAAEGSALDVMTDEIGRAVKDKDEAHIKVWLEQVKEFQRDLEGHRVGYNILNDNGKKVLKDPTLVRSNEEVLALKYKLDDINQKWESLKTKSNTLRNSLEEHFDHRTPIDRSVDEALRWVTDRRNHLEAMKPLGGDLNALRHQLEEVRQFNAKVEAKRDPAVQDVIKNGQAFLAETGYYKALAGEHKLPENKLEESRQLENRIINLQSRWTELMDSGAVWESDIADMLSKVEDMNMNMVDLDLTLKDKKTMVDLLDKETGGDPSKNLPKYQDLFSDVQELKTRVHDINGQAAGLLAQGLHLSKENDKRLQKSNDDWQSLHDTLLQRLGPDFRPMTEPPPTVAKYQPKLAPLAYRPSRDMSYAIKDPTLPPMWEKALTENGVPYYINLKNEVTYWDHPLMMEILNSLTETNYIKYSAYRTAMKLRIIQKRLFLYLFKLGSAIDIFDAQSLRGKNEDYIRLPEISNVSKSIYHKLNQDNPTIVTNVPLSSDLFVDWLLDVYDSLRTGKIRVLSLKVATIILCRAHLIDKYRYLIQLVADPNGNVTKDKLAILLKDMLMIPKYLGEVASFGGSDPGPSVRSCFDYASNSSNSSTIISRPRSASSEASPESRFNQAAGASGSLRTGTSPYNKDESIRAVDFVTWMNRDPQSMVWLPVLYRLAAAETARHQSKCNICKAYPIVGFRYRCLKCLNFDICQQCFFLGKRYKTHKPSHPLHEYSTPTTTGEDVKDLTKTLKNKLFRSKRYFRTHPRLGYLPLEPGTSRQQNVRTFNTGDSSEDEEHRPLVSGPPGGDGSYQASVSPESTLDHRTVGGSNFNKVANASSTNREADIRPRTDKGMAAHHVGKAAQRSQPPFEMEDRVDGPQYDMSGILMGNADEHTLINRYCHDLSNNPSPSLSKTSLNTDDENKIYLDRRIRDLELEHVNLKREYERLKQGHYDSSLDQTYNGYDQPQYSPQLRENKTFPVDGEGESAINFDGYDEMYVAGGNHSSPFNDSPYDHFKNVDSLRLDDSHPYIRLAGSSSTTSVNDMNPLYSVANNLNKAIGDLVTVISSTDSPPLPRGSKEKQSLKTAPSVTLTPCH